MTLTLSSILSDPNFKDLKHYVSAGRKSTNSSHDVAFSVNKGGTKSDGTSKRDIIRVSFANDAERFLKAFVSMRIGNNFSTILFRFSDEKDKGDSTTKWYKVGDKCFGFTPSVKNEKKFKSALNGRDFVIQENNLKEGWFVAHLLKEEDKK